MESLNEQQTDLLTRFQNLTGVDDLSLSIRYLNAANWNIEVNNNHFELIFSNKFNIGGSKRIFK